MTRRLGFRRAAILTTLPLVALAGAAVLEHAVGGAVIALPIVALLVVPVAAYRRTRSAVKTVALSALAVAVTTVGLYVLIVALLADVGEN